MSKEAETQGTQKKRNGVTRWIALILLIGIAATAWIWYVRTRGFVDSDDAYIDADRVSVSSKVLGRITEITANEGDKVQKGDLLVRLDSSDLLAQMAIAKAELLLDSESVSLAGVELARAQSDYNRAKQQFQSHSITTEQYEHAQTELEVAKVKQRIAGAKLNAALTRSAQIDTLLQNMTISSPMSGVVAKRWLLEGDIAAPGQPIYTIYNLDSLWITANLEETKLADLEIGDRATIDVDACPSCKFYGKVLFIGTATASQFSLIPPNNASGNFTKVTQRVPVKISLQMEPDSAHSDPPIQLIPGMSVEIKVKI